MILSNSTLCYPVGSGEGSPSEVWRHEINHQANRASRVHRLCGLDSYRPARRQTCPGRDGQSIERLRGIRLPRGRGFRGPWSWELDQQSMDHMGSPYLLAHGLGTPVADAVTEVAFPSGGTYRVWVRTRDWVAPWKAPGAPGKFQLILDGKPLAENFWNRGRRMALAERRHRRSR